MTPSDLLAAAQQAASRYPHPAYREDYTGEYLLARAAGMPHADAVKTATKQTNHIRRVTLRELSLDAAQEAAGDALRCEPMPAPALSFFLQSTEFGARGEYPQTGMMNPREVELNDLTAIVRNVTARLGIDDLDPLTAAVDIRGFSGNLRDALILVFQSATKDELREAGISRAMRRAAVEWLRAYAV